MSLASHPCRLLPAIAGLLLVAQPARADRIEATMQVSAEVIAICQNVQAGAPSRQRCSAGVSYQLHHEKRAEGLLASDVSSTAQTLQSGPVEVIRISY